MAVTSNCESNLPARSKPQPADFIPNHPYICQPAPAETIHQEADAWLILLKRVKTEAFDKDVVQGKSISGILAGPTAVEIPKPLSPDRPPESLPLLNSSPSSAACC